MHPAILAYLEAETSDFYHIEATLDGKAFVTARGWDDLSRVMHVYEQRGIPVTERLIAQYVQDARTAKRFAVYYDLFNKYRSDYQVDAILAGDAPAEVTERAKAAPFDERVALIGLLTSALAGMLHDTMLEDDTTTRAFEALREIFAACESGAEDAADVRMACGRAAIDFNERVRAGRDARLISSDECSALASAARFLRQCADEPAALSADQAKEAFFKRAAVLDDKAAAAGAAIDAAYAFLDEAFGVGKETLLFTTDLSADGAAVAYIGRYGSASYRAHSRELMLEERAEALQEQARAALQD